MNSHSSTLIRGSQSLTAVRKMPVEKVISPLRICTKLGSLFLSSSSPPEEDSPYKLG